MEQRAIGIVVSIIVFGSLLFLAYITTRFIGQKASGTMKSKHMKVVESISIGMDKQIYLIEVGNKFILVSISGKSIQYLTDVELTDVEIEENSEIVSNNDFSNVFSKLLGTTRIKNSLAQLTEKEQSIKTEQSMHDNTARIRMLAKNIKVNSEGGVENIDG